MADTDLPDLTARIRLDTSELEASVGKAAGVGSAIGSALGGVAGGALQSALGAVSSFTTGSVDAFAQLEDATAAAGVLFGDSVGAIASKAEEAASRVGLSKQQYIDAAATIGTFGQAAGLSGAPLTDFTTKLTDLSGDLASFKGTSTEQAVEAVGAALRGESEPIRAYGVLLDEATIKQEAQRIGLVKAQTDHVKVASAKAALGQAQQKLTKVMSDSKATDVDKASAQAAVARAERTVQDALKGSTPELTKQQKLMATQSAIIRQTTNAQGDFARTSDSTANTQKRLAAESANVQAQLGAKLAPALTAIRVALLGVITNLDSMFGWVQQNIGILAPLAAFIVIATVALNAHAIATGVVSAATRTWTAVQAALNFVLSANPIALIVIGIAALVAAIVIAYQRSETFRAIVDSALAGVRRAFEVSMRAARAVVASVMAFINGDVSGKLGAVRAVVGAVLGFVAGIFRVQFAIIRQIVATVLSIVTTVIRVQLTAARVVIGAVLGFISSTFGTAFGKAKDGAIAALRGLIGFIRTVGGLIKNAFGNPAALLLGIGRDIVEGLLRGIRGAADRVAQAARDMAAKIPGPIRKLLAIGSPSRLMHQYGLWTGEGLADGLDASASLAGAAAARVAEAVTGATSSTLTMPSLTGGASAQFVELSPASLAALARSLPQTLVQVLLDSEPIAARVNERVGADASYYDRSGG